MASSSIGFGSLSFFPPNLTRTHIHRPDGGGVRPLRFSSVRSSGRPLEEIYNVRVERGAGKDRLEKLGVDRWSVWRTGRCRLPWDWHVDQQVYVVSGEVRVVPDGARTGERFMRFVAGDLIRYPKWFEADLFFDGPYEEKYRFRAYGDD